MTVHVDANDPLYLRIVAGVYQTGLFPSINALAYAPFSSQAMVHKRLAKLCAAGLVEHPTRYGPYKLPDNVMIDILSERLRAQEKVKK